MKKDEATSNKNQSDYPPWRCCSDDIRADLPQEQARIASIYAGVVRSAVHALRNVGVSPAFLRMALTRQAFHSLWRTSSNYGSSGSFISPIRHDKLSEKILLEARHASRIGRFESFVKGSVLGIAVFGIYDYLTFKEWKDRFNREYRAPGTLSPTRTREKSSTSEDDRDNVLLQSIVRPTPRRDDDVAAVPLYVHVGAGFLAGLMESAVLDLWEIGSF